MSEQILGFQRMKQPDWIIILWYCLAAVSGAIGGCSAGCASILMDKQQMRIGSTIAYAVIGFMAGLAVYGFGDLVFPEAFKHDTTSLIKWSAIAGSALPIALASNNFVARAVLKRFGFEIEVTIRKEGEERRKAALLEKEGEKNG